MTTHTDRIRQMAQEAGFGIGHSEAAAALFERFAQLVAEDCAGQLEVLCAGQSAPTRKEMEAAAKNIADWFRARYSLKD